jgi:hypothetical protein
MALYPRAAGAVLAAGVLLAACESDSSGPSRRTPGELQIDASSSTAFAYFSFSDNGVVTVTDPATSNAWDLRFRRFSVQLNGGVAGGKDVLGFNLANHANADTATILGFTPENQLAAFDSVGENAIPDEAAFTAEGLGPDFSSWFRFDPVSNGLVANPAAAWKLRRSASAQYALIRVKRIVASNVALDSVVFEYRLQAQGGDLGTIDSVAVKAGSSTAGANLAGDNAVDTTGCGWDLKATADFQVLVNAGCGAATFPLDASEDFAGITKADDAPEYGLFLSLISGPIPNSFSDQHAPFLYNLAGDNRLSSTFNIYLIKVGSSVYKIQLIGYYDDSGNSGHPVLRYAKIR